MKKQSMPLTTKAFNFSRFRLRPLAVAVLLLIGTQGVKAQTQTSLANEPVVHYLGKINGQPVLKVMFENQQGQSYDLDIKDPEGTVIYSDRFSNRNFTRLFQVAQEEPGDMKLTFTFSSGKIKHAQVIEISKKNYVKEDVFISKL
jgi:hypothetical protein